MGIWKWMGETMLSRLNEYMKSHAMIINLNRCHNGIHNIDSWHFFIIHRTACSQMLVMCIVLENHVYLKCHDMPSLKYRKSDYWLWVLHSILKRSGTHSEKIFVILQLCWWLFSSTKHCSCVVILQSYFSSYNV